MNTRAGTRHAPDRRQHRLAALTTTVGRLTVELAAVRDEMAALVAAHAPPPTPTIAPALLTAEQPAGRLGLSRTAVFIDPTLFGVPKRAVTGCRRTLAERGAVRDGDVDLRGVLDLEAAEAGAAERAREAAEQHRRQAADRVREVERVKELRARCDRCSKPRFSPPHREAPGEGTPKKYRVPDVGADGDARGSGGCG